MTPEQFRQLAQQNIFPGESGGDYNALFGYQNRDGGRYAGTRLTDMTVNQALEFSKPSGDYGQHVKGLIGRVATPMGAYQVVGTTLRGARDAMGLTGNEVMTPEMQDRIGAHIYQTQGSGAWEGWGKGGGRGSAPQSSRAPAQAQPVSYSTRGAPEMAQQQAPQGILGALGLQKRDEAAGGQTALPFGQRDNFQDLMGNLAMGFNSMRLNPDANLAQNVQGQREGRRDAQQKNRTIEWLRSQPGGEQFAAMAEAAGVGPALAAYQQDQERQRAAAAAAQGSIQEVGDRLVRVMPDGTTSEVYSPYGDGQLSPDQLSAANVLRDDFRTDTSNFQDTRLAFTDLSAAYNLSTTGDAGVSDYALVIGLAKVLDPTSVVRQEEAAAIQNTSGLSASVKAQFLQIISNGGGSLPPNVRDQIMRLATTRYNNVAADTQTTIDQYVTRAEGAGVPWNQVGFDEVLGQKSFESAYSQKPEMTGAQLGQLGMTRAEWDATWEGMTEPERRDYLGVK